MIKKYALLALLVFSLFACRKDDVENIMTNITFSVQLPEEVHDFKINAELKCININTGEEVRRADVKELSFMQKMLKGYYIVHLNGVVVYEEAASGKVISKKIRGYIDDAIFLKNEQAFVIPVMFL